MDTGKIGPYEVGELIGKGGMGEVYRAHDTRLSRDVALKVLPAAFAADADRLARFDREAKVLASLQHQNIAQIFGLESIDRQPVLVLELAEGEDLNRRIADGPLPTDEARRIARQLALGLEYAHERGVIHRDLKPANVKIGSSGQVKILDFGLARAFSADGGESGSGSFEPTVTQALTQAGAVLGTAAYMSPEQARGYDVDRRSDIWAFGVILFEMLTGRRLFHGETATDTLAAVMRKEPEWDDLPADAPLLAQLCRRCLERDPQQRLRDIGEARIALEGANSSVLGLSTTGLLPPPLVATGRSAGRAPWIVAAVLAVALVGVGFLGTTGRIGPRPPAAPVVLSSVTLPDGMRVDLNPASPGPVQVAPDGRTLAFAAIDSMGRISLCIRDLDSPAVRPLPGTQGASYPFWSHGGGSLAFFSEDGLLRRVDVGGGPVLTVCAAENGKGGDWNQFDEILFAPSHVSGIELVSATGGEPRAVSDLAADREARSHRFPSWLPDGEHFLYLAVQRGSTNKGTDSVLHVAAKDGSLDRELLPVQASAHYSRGHILFVYDQALMARPFDVESLEFTGPAFPICEDVMAIRAAHCATFSAVDGDVLAYSTGQGGEMGVSILEILDRDGNPQGQLGEPLMALGLAYGPRGRFVAVSEPDVQIGTFDLWVHEIERDLSTRLTFDSESEQWPVWSPDGSWLYFSSDRGGRSRIYRQLVSGTGSAELVFDGPDEYYGSSISPDGKTLCYSLGDSTGDLGLGLCSLEGERQPRIFRNTGMMEMAGTFSPDGRWLAYTSFETGTAEIFVESLRPGGGRYRVSSNGGLRADWSPAGDRLYYLSQNGELMAVEVEKAGDALRFGRTTRIADRVEVGDARTFDVNPQTGDLLVVRPSQERRLNSLVLVTGWSGLLDRSKE